MKDKLRELAERWKARPGRVFTENHMLNAGVVMGKCECADELLAILDAEGVAVPIGYADPRSIQGYTLGQYGDFRVSDQSKLRSVPLYDHTHPERSGVVSDEDDVGILRQAEIDWNDGIDTDASQGELMRLCNAGFLEAEQFRITKKGREAIDAAIQGERHER